MFIKNIDNVTTDAQRGDTIRYKKVLAGILLDLQDRAFEYLKALEVGGAELEPIVEFIEQRLCVKLPADYDSALLRAVLDRPIRVCAWFAMKASREAARSGLRTPMARSRSRSPSRARSHPPTSR